MSKEVKENYTKFMQDILAKADAEETDQKNIFLEDICQLLEDEGQISGYDLTEYKLTHSSKSLAVDAWSYDEDRSILTLIYADFRHDQTSQSLTKTQIAQSYKKLRRFVQEAKSQDFFEALEDSAPVKSLVDIILKSDIEKIVLFFVSNAQLSTRVSELPSESVQGYHTTYILWDFQYIHQLLMADQEREELIISFEDQQHGGLACLPAFTGDNDLKSFLLVIPGQLLADLYFEYGDRLLEQNIRTFLQFRGKINKGIRNTIRDEPHMFFSYNNGLSATATKVDLNENNSVIKSIQNLQIVNGGQTTASIFTAHKKDKLCLANIYVQVKLSVVAANIQEEIVPKISEYANTQNKVNAADFFSNHPFHMRVEDLSRRIIAPQRSGELMRTQWFYERTRGQYMNAQSMMTPTEKKTFLNKTPRNQMFTKTDLAKILLSFDEAPYEVSLGAQKAFSGSKKYPGLVGRIGKLWTNSNGTYVNEDWFKQTVAKIIIFNRVDRLIFKSSWYCGYKANILTYSIAKFMNMIKLTGKHFNFVEIWSNQDVPIEIIDLFKTITSCVQEIILTPKEGFTRNIGEWTKKEECWNMVKGLEIKLIDSIESYLIDEDDFKQQKQDGKKIQIIDDGINMVTCVVTKGGDYWSSIRDWGRHLKLFSTKELSILNTGCSIPRRIPTDKQAAVLLEIEKRAIEEGFKLNSSENTYTKDKLNFDGRRSTRDIAKGFIPLKRKINTSGN